MPRLQHKPVSAPDEVRPYELGQNELFDMDDFVVGRMVHNPGWHWRTHVRPIAGTERCMYHHLGYVVSGTLHVQMEDGTEDELGPREMFDRLENSVTLRRVDDEPVWSVVCFYVHPTAKRQGVARALLAGAEALAARHGARLVEAYPVGPKQINLDAYTGYAPMYEAAGYDIVRRAGRRTVMRKGVEP